MPESSKADPLPEVDEHRRDLWREACLAFAACTRWVPSRTWEASATAEQHTQALVFLPVAGLIFGVMMALVDRALTAFAPPFARSAFTIAMAVLVSGGLFPTGLARTVTLLIDGKTGNLAGPRVRPSGTAAAILLLTAEILALGALANPPARARAMVLAMLLSRWAIVPIGYGLRPLEESGLGIGYFGAIRFSEFAISSVIALGAAMGLYDVMGLAAIVAVAIAILGLRLLFSRRLGGVGGNALAAGAMVCELVIFATLAAISAL